MLVDRVDQDLHLVGSIEIVAGSHRADLKTIEHSHRLPPVALAVSRDERNDLLASDASRQSSRINLVVPGHHLITVLRQETETQLSPAGVTPLGADNERNNSVIIGVDSLDGEEEIVGRQ